MANRPAADADGDGDPRLELVRAAAAADRAPTRPSSTQPPSRSAIWTSWSSTNAQSSSQALEPEPQALAAAELGLRARAGRRASTARRRASRACCASSKLWRTNTSSVAPGDALRSHPTATNLPAPRPTRADQPGSSSRLRSSAGAEWVSAPTEISSTPVAAISATLLERDPARGLQRRGAAGRVARGDRRAQLGRRSCCRAAAGRRPRRAPRATSARVAALDLDLELRMRRARRARPPRRGRRRARCGSP